MEALKKHGLDHSKVQELVAMEEALKKATEEAHQQRLALAAGQSPESAESSTSAQSESGASKKLQELKKQQEAEQSALIQKLDQEEK